MLNHFWLARSLRCLMAKRQRRLTVMNPMRTCSNGFVLGGSDSSPGGGRASYLLLTARAGQLGFQNRIKVAPCSFHHEIFSSDLSLKVLPGSGNRGSKRRKDDMITLIVAGGGSLGQLLLVSGRFLQNSKPLGNRIWGDCLNLGLLCVLWSLPRMEKMGFR